MKKFVVLSIICAMLFSCSNKKGYVESSIVEIADNTKVEKTLEQSNVLTAEEQSKEITTDGQSKVIAADEQPKVLTAEDIYGQSINKVAMIICYKDGVPYSQGSGFFIGKDTLVTNFHCIAGAERIEFKIAGNEHLYKGAKVVRASEDYDLAIIKTQQEFSFMKMDSTCNEKVGSRIYAIGNPRGLEGTISDGILSGKRDNNGIEYLQITAPINPGNSGGPVLNEKGKVIGVATFTFRNSQNLNFAMPIKYISKCKNYVVTENKLKKQTYTDNDNGVSIAKFSIVSDPLVPCRAFVSIRNNTEQNVSGIMGQMVFYDKDGEMYDYFDFKIRETISPKMTKQTYIAVGNDRIYPQGWGIAVELFYKLSGTPKAGIFRYSHYRSSFDYAVNQAKTIEMRIIYYDLDE